MGGPDSQNAEFRHPFVKRTGGLVQSAAADYQGGEQTAAERTNFTRGIAAVKLIVAIQESEDGGVPLLQALDVGVGVDARRGLLVRLPI